MNYLLLSFLSKSKLRFVFATLLFFCLGITSTAYSQNFRTTWITTDNTITIPTTGTGYNYTVVWTNLTNTGVGNGSATAQTGDYTLTGLQNGNTYEIAISGDFPHFYMNYNTTERTKLRSIREWGNIAWTSMESAFSGCENLTYTATDVPNLSGVTSMSNMFGYCSSFNANLNSWNTSTITDMSSMFRGATVFNGSIVSWNTAAVTNMRGMFIDATFFNQFIGTWNTAAVTNMNSMFSNATYFNRPIGTWNTAAVTDMSSMFFNASSFNQSIANWNTGAVTDMKYMFAGAYAYNQYMANWNTAAVTNMTYMFSMMARFNQFIGNWDTGNVTDMSGMFAGTTSFNQPIGNWNTGNVTNMSSMFNNTYFNQDISNWNTAAVTNMSNMFNTGYFNKPLANWNTGNVTNMSQMFYLAPIFNQNISNWNTAAVTNMSQMFKNAYVFNQDLSNWNVTNIVQTTPTNGMYGMLDNSALNTANYDALLTNWSAQTTNSNIKLGAASLYYCTAQAARNTLISTKNWIITGDAMGCPEINVKGNGINIANNDNTPSSNDNTDFGSGTNCQSISKTFTIQNTGTATILLTGHITITGSSDFTLSTQPSSSSIATASSQTFVLTYTASQVGLQTALVSISNNDSDENPYTFTIQGTGTGNFPLGTWQNVGIAGFSTGSSLHHDLEFNPITTEPYIAYYDGTEGGRTTVMRFDGTSWQTVGIAGFSAGSSICQSLAFHPTTNEPYIAFQDGGNGNKTTVMRFNGTSWQNVGSAGFSTTVSNNQSLAFHPITHEPYVAYSDVGNGGSTTVKRFNGTTWLTVGLLGFSLGSASYQSLAFNPLTNEPYVAYSDGGNFNKTTVMRFNGSSWRNVGTTGFSVAQASFQNLAFNPVTNEPYVSYSDGGNSFKATVMRFDGTEWQTVGTAGFSAGLASYPNIAFHPTTNQPYIAYHDDANGSKTTAMRFDGTSWQIVGTAGFSAGNSYFGSMAFHPTSHELYVGYKDIATNDKTTVMRFKVGSPDINIQGNNTNITDGNTIPLLGNHTDFGNVDPNGTVTYTIQNTGTADLIVSSIDISGTNASEFVVSPITFPIIITAGNTATFDITFTPTGLGTRTAIITVNNNDCDEGNYDFAVQGTKTISTLSEINLQGNGIDITNNDVTPNTTDNTDFGSILACNSNTIAKTFTIQNTGTAPLTISNLIINGTNASDFALSGLPTFPFDIAANNNQTFTVTFNASVTGTRTANIQITNNDADENPYTFAIQAAGTADNQIPTITAPSNITANTDTGICTASNITLGNPIGTDNCGTVTFSNNAPAIFPIGTTTIIWTANDGNGNTNTANQIITISDNQIPTITAPSNVTATTDTGICTASNITLGNPIGTDNCGTVTFSNNAPLVFPIGTTTVIWTANDGNGNTATANQLVTISDSKEINLLGNGNTIADGTNITSTNDNTDFGDVGNTRTITYTIENTGTENISINSITSNNLDFVVSNAPTTVLAGSVSTVNVTFSAANLGLSSAIITLNNNDCDESVYNFAIQATKISVIPPPPPAPIEANLKLNAIAVSSTRINLNWSTNAQATSYLLYRNEVLVGQILATANTYSDINLTPDTFYQYKLIAVINSTNSLPSSDNEWTFPEKPTLLSLSSVCGNGGKATINLTATGSIFRVYNDSINGSLLLESTNGNFELPFTNQTTTFYISVIGNSGKESKRLAINVTLETPFESMILGENTQSSCTNSLLLKAQLVENADFYTWFFNGIQINTGLELMATSSGIYQLRITKGNCSYLSTTVNILLNQNPLAKIEENKENQSIYFCENGTLNAIQNSQNSSLNSTYEWKLNNVVIGQNPTLEVSESGIYSLFVSTSTCTDSTSIEVTITETPQIPILKTQKDSICKDSETTLFVENAEAGMSYLWVRNGRLLSEFSSSITTNVQGNYQVVAFPEQDIFCNSTSNEIEIFHFADFVAYLRENKESNSIFTETANFVNQITTVEWYFEGELKTELGNSFEIIPTEKGNYSAKVTNQNGCIFQTRTIYFTPKITITGEDETKTSTFKIYPNPSNGIFKVQFETVLLENTEVTIFDGIGRKIHIQTFEKGNQDFNVHLNNQPKGMYLLHFNQNGATYSKQIVIE